MDSNYSKAINLLEKVRYIGGIEKLIDFFVEISKKDFKKLLELINNEDLSFTTLFLLHPKLAQLGIFEELSIRNKIAVGFINENLLNKKQYDKSNLLSEYMEKRHSVLKWIIETGSCDDGLSNEFDELLDIAAAILSKEYRDRSVLPIISDMIFMRNRKGFFVHDLVWAFFESKDIQSLVLIGNKLLSMDRRDVELACSLLCFVPGIEFSGDTKGDDMYEAFNSWIEENNSFLYFTGESFQLTRKPMICAINNEAKYLCKMVCPDTGEVLKPLNKNEYNLVDEFKKLDNEDKRLLAGFSLAMHRKNIDLWNEWISSPINEQLRTARYGGLKND